MAKHPHDLHRRLDRGERSLAPAGGRATERKARPVFHAECTEPHSLCDYPLGMERTETDRGYNYAVAGYGARKKEAPPVLLRKDR